MLFTILLGNILQKKEIFMENKIINILKSNDLSELDITLLPKIYFKNNDLQIIIIDYLKNIKGPLNLKIIKIMQEIDKYNQYFADLNINRIMNPCDFFEIIKQDTYYYNYVKYFKIIINDTKSLNMIREQFIWLNAVIMIIVLCIAFITSLICFDSNIKSNFVEILPTIIGIIMVCSWFIIILAIIIIHKVMKCIKRLCKITLIENSFSEKYLSDTKIIGLLVLLYNINIKCKNDIIENYFKNNFDFFDNETLNNMYNSPFISKKNKDKLYKYFNNLLFSEINKTHKQIKNKTNLQKYRIR